MTSLPDLPEIPEQVEINTEAQIEALRSPVRMRILSTAREPRSVRQIAEALDMPVTRLYYHINLLNEVGYLEIVHTRKSGARIEKLYRVAGKSIVVGEDLMQNASDHASAARALASVVIEPALFEAEAAIEERMGSGPDERIHLGRSLARLTPEEVAVIGEKVETLIKDHIANRDDSDNPDAEAYAFTYAFLPTAPF